MSDLLRAAQRVVDEFTTTADPDWYLVPQDAISELSAACFQERKPLRKPLTLDEQNQWRAELRAIRSGSHGGNSGEASLVDSLVERLELTDGYLRMVMDGHLDADEDLRELLLANTRLLAGVRVVEDGC